MIEVSNLTAQTLQPGQAVTFNNIIHHKGCGECYTRQLPTSVRLKGGCDATYEVSFSGNIASATAGAAMQLAIALENQPLVETAMNSTPSTANVLNNIGTGTFVVLTCADVDRISVINSGTVPVTLAPNANLRIRRIC